MIGHRRRIAPRLAATLLAMCGCSSGNGATEPGDGAVAPSASGGAQSGGAAGSSAGGAGANARGGTSTSVPHDGGNGASGDGAGGAAQGGAATQTGGAPPSDGSGGETTGGGGRHAGGSTGSGGATASGGTTGSSGSAGVSSNGGTGGAATGTNCKRGVAANTAPGAAFFPAIGWWYDWSMKRSGADVGIEFVPMMWGKSDVNTAVPAGSKYLLTFNEPNFHAQSNLTAQQAASYWPTIEKAANAAHVPIVSPAMNFCGPADQCNGTSPYQYLKDFFTACTSCKVDYVAVHWYNCDLPSLKDYLEPGGNLEGFEQFGKPIWLTEFSCNGSASEADQEKFMRAAIPYLEGNAHVYRYSWFSAGPVPNAELMNSDGSPTALGKVYIGLDGACR